MNRVSVFEGGIDRGSMVISQVEMCDSLALNARENGRSRRTMSSPECNIVLSASFPSRSPIQLDGY